MRWSIAYLLFLILVCGAARAQSTGAECTIPPEWLGTSRNPDMFGGERRADLAEVSEQRLREDYPVVDDAALNAPLNVIGERLERAVPGAPPVQWSLFELPTVNAFTLPGGRILVARKAVAFAESEDELAAIMAHELGHAVTRQPETELTAVIRKVLGTTEVTSRQQVFDVYNHLIDNEAKHPGAMRAVHMQRDEEIADAVGAYILARAGYDPQAHARLWDRFAGTQGKMGSAFSNFFGSTPPEQKRLRAMVKLANTLPAGCAALRQPTGAIDFRTWREQVVAYTETPREAVPGLISKVELDSPIRDDVAQLRFSPDGKNLLAQDAAGMFVVAREPMQVRFRISMDDIVDTHFTPDSRAIVFVTDDLRVERWDVAGQRREWVRELPQQDSCRKKALSPDGRVLACYTYEGDLELIEVETSKVLFVKKDFAPTLDFGFAVLGDIYRLLLQWLQPADMEFSPDGHYFLAGRRDATLGYDVNTRSVMSLPGSVKALMGRSFIFMADGDLAGAAGPTGEKSAVVHFPSGETVTKQMMRGTLGSAAHGNYVLLRPVAKYPVGVLNLSTGKVFASSKTTAMDVYDDVFVTERGNGELGLYRVGTIPPFAFVPLPKTELAGVASVALSSDGHWLALSERGRGAVWDLRRNKRVLHIHGFQGAYFNGDRVYLKVTLAANERKSVPAKDEDEESPERLIVSFDLNDPATSGTRRVIPVADSRLQQYGRYLVQLRPAEPGKYDKAWVLEARDVIDDHVLWTRPMPKELPATNSDSSSIALVWGLESKAAKDAIKQDPALVAKRKTMGDKKNDYYVEVVELATGHTAQRMLIETGEGSFRIARVATAPGYLVLSDSRNRVLFYSTATGEQKAHFFGHWGTVVPTLGVLLVESERGKLDVYDPTTLEKRNTLRLPAGIIAGTFTPDGKQMVLVDRNQTVYRLDVAQITHK